LLLRCGDFLHRSMLLPLPLPLPTGTGDLSSPLGGECERGGLCRESLRVFLVPSSRLVRDGDGSVEELTASWFVPTGGLLADDDGLLRRPLLRLGEDDRASLMFSGRRCSRRS
jgi:hypothetical protein